MLKVLPPACGGTEGGVGGASLPRYARTHRSVFTTEVRNSYNVYLFLEFTIRWQCENPRGVNDAIPDRFYAPASPPKTVGGRQN